MDRFKNVVKEAILQSRTTGIYVNYHVIRSNLKATISRKKLDGIVIINPICVLGGRKFTLPSSLCIKRNQYAYDVFISCYRKTNFPRALQTEY